MSRNSLDEDLVWLLDSLQPAPATAADAGRSALREKLFGRVARSAAASRAMFTVRRKDTQPAEAASGVRLRTLYRSRGAGAASLRRGEPQRVLWIELDPGARWAGPDGGWPAGTLQRDWLVVAGEARVGGHALETFDYHVVPAGHAVGEVSSAGGCTLVLREAAIASAGEAASTNRQQGADWIDFAPGIQRRMLWTRGGEAAMLYRALPGAAVPHHGHGHDEECLMLEGELFLDEVLLRAGEYQLAPAGSEHGGLFTDTGVVIYAHGDLDLAVIA